MKKELIPRDFYIDKLIRSMWNGEIKVITGLRRSGKSVLLFDFFYDYLLGREVTEEQIIKIELAHSRSNKYRNPIVLCDYIEEMIKNDPDKDHYLFIDDVGLIKKVVDKENGGIEVTIYDVLNELKNYKNLDVYVTGSNSAGLSGAVPTEFRGRATQIHLYPLSFEEFYSHVGLDEDKALENYMRYGGMPELLSIEEKDKRQYLESLYEELYLKDIMERYKIKRVGVLNDILDLLASQLGSPTNPTKIANTLMSKRNEKISTALVSGYIRHATDSFLLHMARRYDVKRKSYFKYPNKYYYTDIGLRNARLSFKNYDPGNIMENLIYNDLIRRGYTVGVGVVKERTEKHSNQKQIDFVASKADKKVYIQSAFCLDDSNREFNLKPLTLTGDFFKKIIVRMDIPHNFYDANGIFHCNLIDFLLGRVEIF